MTRRKKIIAGVLTALAVATLIAEKVGVLATAVSHVQEILYSKKEAPKVAPTIIETSGSSTVIMGNGNAIVINNNVFSNSQVTEEVARKGDLDTPTISDRSSPLKGVLLPNRMELARALARKYSVTSVDMMEQMAILEKVPLPQPRPNLYYVIEIIAQGDTNEVKIRTKPMPCNTKNAPPECTLYSTDAERKQHPVFVDPK